jgi:DNA-binding transcriptional MerR regulator
MKPNLVEPIHAMDPSGNSTEAGAADMVAQGDSLTISEMATKFDVTPRALRFYESKGLLKPAREGRGRIYRHDDQQHLSLILKGRKLGFTIAEIGEMIAAEEGHASQRGLRMTREKCQDQITHLERQLAETTEALAELRRMLMALSR